MGVEQTILETMAAETEIGVDDEFPKIRKLRKVADDKGLNGYSFEFEAFVEGQWREYGPVCCGNWTCLRGHDCLPDSDTIYFNRCFPDERRPYFRTIGIGIYTLNRLYVALKTAEERGIELPEQYQGVLADEPERCQECGEAATLYVPADPEGDPESFWCEQHGKDRIDSRPIE
jgi:hypothetical protein